METNFNKKLCKHIISRQQKDLFVIFKSFQDKIGGVYNTFFMQNSALDKILQRIDETKKSTVSLSYLFKAISLLEKDALSALELEEQIIQSSKYCKIIGVDFFDENVFMEVLDRKLEDIVTNYNLNANDDYNKLYMILSSLQLSLQSSDDILHALSNQYSFFSNHKDEYITIYNEKYYKIDILNEIIDLYKEAILDEKLKLSNNTNRKC